METDNLSKAVNGFYDRLAMRENRALRDMAAAYSRTIDKLAGDIFKTLAADETLSRPNHIFLLQRYGKLITDAAGEWGKYASAATEVLSPAQLDAIRLGAKLTNDVIVAGIPEGVSLNRQWDYLSNAALHETVGSLQDGSPLRGLVSEVAGNMRLAMTRELVTGIATGKGPRAVASAWSKLFDAERHRLNTIARTEILRSSREGSRRAMINNSDIMEGWQWYSRRDRRTCAVCYAMHGSIFPLRIKMGTHPNCRCSLLPKTKSWQQLGFSSSVPNAENPAFLTPSEKMLDDNPQLCRLVLGKGGCFGFRQGLIKLPEFVLETKSPRWGNGRTVKPLRAIVGPSAAKSLTAGIIPGA